MSSNKDDDSDLLDPDLQVETQEDEEVRDHQGSQYSKRKKKIQLTLGVTMKVHASLILYRK